MEQNHQISLFELPEVPENFVRKDNLFGTFHINTRIRSMKDSSNAHIFTYEVWENKHPDRLSGQMFPFEADFLSAAKFDECMSLWKSLAEEFSDPILTIQGDVRGGTVRGYRYEDGRSGPPPNAIAHVIKPIFDPAIAVFNCYTNDSMGNSLVYHCPMSSPTLREEVEKFNQLLIRFFSGEDLYKTLNKPASGFYWEIVVSKEELDKYSG